MTVEAVAGGAWGSRWQGVGEWIRQAVDLEHWGAFQRSFQQVADLVTEVADGRRGTPRTQARHDRSDRAVFVRSRSASVAGHREIAGDGGAGV